mmetsp:Transcript_83881/g.245950  ORF Transcript_83881/g.245950 Transcript_83881/m.245950 type:complete len:293 (-) Transcript_83881:317-1195(-)
MHEYLPQSHPQLGAPSSLFRLPCHPPRSFSPLQRHEILSLWLYLSPSPCPFLSPSPLSCGLSPASLSFRFSQASHLYQLSQPSETSPVSPTSAPDQASASELSRPSRSSRPSRPFRTSRASRAFRASRAPSASPSTPPASWPPRLRQPSALPSPCLEGPRRRLPARRPRRWRPGTASWRALPWPRTRPRCASRRLLQFLACSQSPRRSGRLDRHGERSTLMPAGLLLFYWDGRPRPGPHQRWAQTTNHTIQARRDHPNSRSRRPTPSTSRPFCTRPCYGLCCMADTLLRRCH